MKKSRAKGTYIFLKKYISIPLQFHCTQKLTVQTHYIRCREKHKWVKIQIALSKKENRTMRGPSHHQNPQPVFTQQHERNNVIEPRFFRQMVTQSIFEGQKYKVVRIQCLLKLLPLCSSLSVCSWSGNKSVASMCYFSRIFISISGSTKFIILYDSVQRLELQQYISGHLTILLRR